MPLVRNQKKIKFSLLLIIVIGLALRLYGIANPLVDSHHQRQTQTAMVTRNLYEDGMNIFKTRYDIYGNTSGIAILEFPFINTLTSLLYYIFGVHEIIGRLIAITFSIGAIFMMYKLAGKFVSNISALVATAFYALSPTSIYFGRAFMPEPIMMFFMITALYFTLEYLDKNKISLFLYSALFFALTFLSKSTTVFLIVPVGMAWIVRYGRRAFLRWDLYLILVLSIAPVAAWSLYGSRMNALVNPEWSIGNLILKRGGNWAFRFSPTFWLGMFKSVSGPLLTPLGFILTATGIAGAHRHRYHLILYTWLVAVISYLFIFAEINFYHPYYQLPLLPLSVLFIGSVADAWIEQKSMVSRWMNVPLARLISIIGLLTVVAGYIVIYYIFFSDLYDVEKRVPYHLEAARIIREQTPADSVLILNDPPNELNTTLTYYSHRKSWSFPVQEGEKAIQALEDYHSRGATVYVAINSAYGNGASETRQNNIFWDYLRKNYSPIVISDNFIIFDLRRRIY